MKEVSVLSLLNIQQEKNHTVYDELFSSLNLSRLDRFNSLPETTESSYKVLYSAGFIPGSIVDRLTKSSLKVLVQLAKEDTSRLFLKEDIRQVAQQYGLKFLETRHYKSHQKQMFVDDLSNFQQRLVAITDNPYWASDLFSSRYLLLGPSRAFDGMEASKFKAPLLFYNIGEDIYYLISTHDSWIRNIRKVFYWPLAGMRRMIGTWAFMFFAFVSIMVASDHPIIIIGTLLLYMFCMFFTLVKFNWSAPDDLPVWFKRKMYRIVPC